MEQESFPVPGPGGKRPALIHWAVCLMLSEDRGRVKSHAVSHEPGSPTAQGGFWGMRGQPPGWHSQDTGLAVKAG